MSIVDRLWNFVKYEAAYDAFHGFGRLASGQSDISNRSDLIDTLNFGSRSLVTLGELAFIYSTYAGYTSDLYYGKKPLIQLIAVIGMGEALKYGVKSIFEQAKVTYQRISKYPPLPNMRKTKKGLGKKKK